MALLRSSPRTPAWLAAIALASSVAACSILYDPDDLALPGTGDDIRVEVEVGTGDSVADAPGPDGDAGPELVIAHTGQSGCTLQYRNAVATQCPTACGWELVFSADQSRGHAAFAWRFAATGSYRVSPETATGARVTVTLQPPSCELIPGTTVGPARVLADISPDGGPFRSAATLDFNVQQVGQCAATDLCPTPPDL